MPSERESFFTLGSFAIVGDTNLAPFPQQLYQELGAMQPQTFAVDLAGSRYVSGDEAFPELRLLPIKVEGVIATLPRHRVGSIAEAMIRIGIGHLWVRGAVSIEVARQCAEHQIAVLSGNPRVYTQTGLSWARFFAKIFGQY